MVFGVILVVGYVGDNLTGVYEGKLSAGAGIVTRL
jgi:hypothetical protein